MEKLLWIDMEMTGLDIEKEVIIEVAAIVTNLNFMELETYGTPVFQEQKFLDSMDDWNKKTHTESGLTDLVKKGRLLSHVESDLLKLIERHYHKNERPVLAGNSIAQDRLFIDKYMKTLSARLHYRMLDVTSWKVIFKEKYRKEYSKKNRHRAIDDIRESMDELKYYIQFIDPAKI